MMNTIAGLTDGPHKMTTTDEKVSNPDRVTTSASSKEDKKKNPKRMYQQVSNFDRLRLIMMIKQDNFSCFKAARLLNIPYTNAKVIYRVYSREGRLSRNKNLSSAFKTHKSDKTEK